MNYFIADETYMKRMRDDAERIKNEKRKDYSNFLEKFEKMMFSKLLLIQFPKISDLESVEIETLLNNSREHNLIDDEDLEKLDLLNDDYELDTQEPNKL